MCRDRSNEACQLYYNPKHHFLFFTFLFRFFNTEKLRAEDIYCKEIKMRLIANRTRWCAV